LAGRSRLAENMLVSERRKHRKRSLLRLLDSLESLPGWAVSSYFPPGLSISEIEKTIDMFAGPVEIAGEVSETVSNSPTGGVLLWGEQGRYLVLPPFPPEDRVSSSGFDVEPLRSLLLRDLTIALVLVRLGAYAVGVFRGEELVSSKVGTGHIHSRHKKGGSSQRRFERGREKQIEYFFERVCTRTRDRLAQYLGEIEHVFYGGERHTVREFRRQCRFVTALDDRVSARLLNVREPRQATLEAAIEEVWASQVIEWREEDSIAS